jgi:hypothetical protein
MKIHVCTGNKTPLVNNQFTDCAIYSCIWYNIGLGNFLVYFGIRSPNVAAAVAVVILVVVTIAFVVVVMNCSMSGTWYKNKTTKTVMTMTKTTTIIQVWKSD